jgi:hypothetical protein
VKGSGKPAPIAWLEAPVEKNFAAAQSYLALAFEPADVARLAQALRAASPATFAAKDIFRASGLSLLGVSNDQVERFRRKIMQGEPIAPLLLVRAPALAKVVIADGYHRLCAVYGYHEDEAIPCRIA